ncbi:hypothetical protein SAMN04487884_13231 [Butyrivibrio fibrisolvens]|uniref:Uncharacterized protein n=1 Tax=Butyrivibrio fibrisolvens TaxID=831 RepID=A0A1H9WP35_BUTFI|nr:hypothetical protein [Butyrivibrio fibrisolvens]SES35668.1 hypothetical protein SAMN04487884_13231 [Butyrivibrio fibrisolvens]
MDKNQVIEILTTKGFRAHDTNGILYVDLEDIAPASIEKIRTMLKELHYYNSWGVKKVLVGAQPPSNVKVIDSSAQNNTIEDEESDDNNDIYPETKEVLDNTVLDNRYRSEDEMDMKNEISTEDEDQDLDDDMTFDENSPFEQVSLFDIMR